MSTKELEVIDHTAHLAHEWIAELTDRLDWTSRRDAMRLLRATLSAVRDHLGHSELAQFGAQMPILIRGMYYEGWVPAATPVKERHLTDFLARIENQIGEVREYRGVEDVSTVLKLLNARISQGEVSDVRAGLPGEIKDIWPD